MIDDGRNIVDIFIGESTEGENSEIFSCLIDYHHIHSEFLFSLQMNLSLFAQSLLILLSTSERETRIDN